MRRMLGLASLVVLLVAHNSFVYGSEDSSQLENKVSVSTFPFGRSLTKKYPRQLIEIEDVDFDGKPFVPEIVGFLKDGELKVSGDVMRARAKELNANLGQRHLKYLEDHQELIPKGWRGKYYLVAPGTLWPSWDGYLHISCLNWDGGRWYLEWGFFGFDWGGGARLVTFRK